MATGKLAIFGVVALTLGVGASAAGQPTSWDAMPSEVRQALSGAMDRDVYAIKLIVAGMDTSTLFWWKSYPPHASSRVHAMRSHDRSECIGNGIIKGRS